MLESAICMNLPQYSEVYTYDNDGNFLTKMRTDKNISYSYLSGTNKLNLVKVNGVQRHFSYDGRGNVINDGKVTVNEYDHRNMALNVTTPSGVALYNYDDGGNRLAKKVGSTWEYYLHDQAGRELAVIDVNTGKLKQVNLFGNDQIGSVDITWGADSATCNKQYYIKDHLGSIRIAKSSSGSILSARNYYPYGETMQEYQSGTKNRKYRFTGKERDDETNQDYFGARYYDSELGRWNTVDPMVDKFHGLSGYNYCVNNPVALIDPTGKWPSWIHDELINRFTKDTDQRKYLKSESYKADNDPGTQDPKNSFMHAMRNFTLGYAEGVNQIDVYLNNKAVSPGAKLHCIMDMTAPSHEGVQTWGDPYSKSSSDSPITLNDIAVLVHTGKELSISEEQKEATVDLMRLFVNLVNSGTSISYEALANHYQNTLKYLRKKSDEKNRAKKSWSSYDVGNR